MKLDVRESQVEDALVSVSELARQILNLEDEPRLLARQMKLPSGRLDLLYTHRASLILVELKAVGFNNKFLTQILGYKNDLTKYQQEKKLLNGDIKPYLLCAETSQKAESMAQKKGVTLTQYNPQNVLESFYKNFKPVAFFTQIKPADIGVWNLHLINKFIYHLPSINSIDALIKAVGGSQKTLYNKVSFAHKLRLINWQPNKISITLTDLGKTYIAAKNHDLPEKLSEEQAIILQKFIMQNPYESPVTLGIASVVESVFILSKNTYPVPIYHLEKYFPYYAGKIFDWKKPKAKFNGTNMYSNYATDLGLLAKTQDTVYLTPEGLRFTIQMQMHKSLKIFQSMHNF